MADIDEQIAALSPIEKFCGDDVIDIDPESASNTVHLSNDSRCIRYGPQARRIILRCQEIQKITLRIYAMLYYLRFASTWYWHNIELEFVGPDSSYHQYDITNIMFTVTLDTAHKHTEIHFIIKEISDRQKDFSVGIECVYKIELGNTGANMGRESTRPSIRQMNLFVIDSPLKPRGKNILILPRNLSSSVFSIFREEHYIDILFHLLHQIESQNWEFGVYHANLMTILSHDW